MDGLAASCFEFVVEENLSDDVGKQRLKARKLHQRLLGIKIATRQKKDGASCNQRSHFPVDLSSNVDVKFKMSLANPNDSGSGDTEVTLSIQLKTRSKQAALGGFCHRTHTVGCIDI